jgi:serine/threonine-protein kinase RsbW
MPRWRALPVPDRGAAPGPVVCLTFDAAPAHVRRALADLVATPPVAGLPPAARATVELVLAEVLNNIAEHAYAGAGGWVSVDLALSSHGLACQIADRGQPMPACRLPDGRLWADPATPLCDLPEGGFGWSLIRSLTADLRYRRDAGGNRLGFVIPFGP